MNLKRVQQHLKTYLLVYVGLAMFLGLLLGYHNTSLVKAHKSSIKTLTTVIVFFIIYPMMVNLKLESLAEAGRNWKGLTLALVYNFIWAPLFGYMLARGYLHDPLLALGFLMVMVVPCSSMSIGYTGLAGGNVELATVTVALSFIVAAGAVPIWMTVFAGQYNVPVPVRDMLISILEVLVTPMILGYLTRLVLIRWSGAKRYKELQPLFPSLSLLAMFAIVFVIFFAKAAIILGKWQMVALLLIPETLFFVVTLPLETVLNRKLHIPYDEHMALVFASTGKNNGTAIALAATAFSPLVAVPAAVMPVFQIFFLVTYLKFENVIKQYFGILSAKEIDIGVEPKEEGTLIDMEKMPF